MLREARMKLILLLILTSTHTFAQWIASDEIDESKVVKWQAAAKTDYQGVYHFGDSEAESDLVIIVLDSKVIGQIKSGSWSDDGKAWISNYENIVDIRLEGNRFISSKANGEFVIYTDGDSKTKGLKITNPWSGIPEDGDWEIGVRKAAVKEFLEGRFPQASIERLDKNELTRLTKSDLKIMRNEIFSRYGLKFKAGGEMDVYFRKQEWYTPQHTSVDGFLTELEKENLRLIKTVEGN